MVYPRSCPHCGVGEPSPELLYSTRRALDGGTRSPWRPELPGRILDLRCGACSAVFRWDYFASALVTPGFKDQAAADEPPEDSGA